MSNAFVVSPIENGCPLPTRPMSAPTGIDGIVALSAVRPLTAPAARPMSSPLVLKPNLAGRLEPQVLTAAHVEAGVGPLHVRRHDDRSSVGRRCRALAVRAAAAAASAASGPRRCFRHRVSVRPSDCRRCGKPGTLFTEPEIDARNLAEVRAAPVREDRNERISQ